MKALAVFLLASSVLACEYGGKTFKDKEEWTEKEAFRLRCVVNEDGSWKTEVTSCVTTDGKFVPVNGQLRVGDLEWNCTITPEGQVALKSTRAKDAKCEGKYNTGEKYKKEGFVFECTEGGVQKFVGCASPLGNDKVIASNGTEEIGGFIYTCLRYVNGTVALQAKATPKS